MMGDLWKSFEPRISTDEHGYKNWKTLAVKNAKTKYGRTFSIQTFSGF
jgi:hypothetical protein